MLAGAIGAAGSLFAGGLNYYGQKQANKANIASARESMDFQERMSSTAYQRSMEDMRKAGLNPILAAKLGGASTPGGSTAQSQNELSGAVSSGLEAKRLKADIELIRENALLARVNQRATEADIANKALSTASQVRLQNAQGDYYDSEIVKNAITGKQILAQTEGIHEDVKGKRLEGAIDETKFGSVMRYINRVAGILPFVKATRAGS